MQPPSTWHNATSFGARTEAARIAILATDGVELDELLRAERALELAGARALLVAPKRGRIAAHRGRNGAGELEVERVLEASDVAHFDGLLIPGGVWHTDALRALPSAIVRPGREHFTRHAKLQAEGHESNATLWARLKRAASMSHAAR